MDLLELLCAVKEGSIPIEEALKLLKPVEELGFARLDVHRERRIGFPEVIFGENKTLEQLIPIVQKMRERSLKILITRLDKEKAEALQQEVPGLTYHPVARCLTWEVKGDARNGFGEIMVVCAGTSDLPVAEEAAITAELFGCRVNRVTDVGVAGIHRLFPHIDAMNHANAVIVVAGMEGALPSVIGGLISKPVIAVPTSVGYGANFHGISALLSMLNSCAPGITVVNIDNGFGAGYFAALLTKNLEKACKEYHG